jgi:hypothetical protein
MLGVVLSPRPSSLTGGRDHLAIKIVAPLPGDT